MKYLRQNNRNPVDGVTFEEIAKKLIEDGNGIASLKAQVTCGNHRFASFVRVAHDDPQAIEVCFYTTVLATLYDDDSVRLHPFPDGFDTITTWKTMDWCLRGIGFRVSRVVRTRKIYSIRTGAYRDYHAGMIVRKGDF